MPTKRLASALALALCLTATASASATTYHASPASTRAQAPCTPEAPCKLSFALSQSFSGDDVALAPGAYDHHASDPLEVRPGVVLHGAPGRIRPLIEQTVPYGDCDGCAILELRGGSVLRDVDVAQHTEGGGAVRAPGDATIERSALRGRSRALWLTGGTGPSGSVREVLAIAVDGVAIVSELGGPTRQLENVTAIGHGGLGIGLSSRSSAGTDDTIDAVNTIARGDHRDVQALAGSSAGIDDVARVKLRYSNFRLDRIEKLESDPAWSNAQVETFDNNQHADPQFASATDFHQAEGSPTIDSGRVNGLLGTLDIDGEPRAFGAKPDIGADERHPVEPEPESETGDQGRHEPERPPHNHNEWHQPEQPKPVAGLALTRQTVTVKKNAAAIRVECPAAGSCAGTLVLTSGKVKVGSAKFSVPAGQRALVRIKLSKAARKLIARKGKLRATATAQTTKALVTLKQPKRRR